MLVKVHCRSVAAAESVIPDLRIFLINIMVYGHMATITAAHISKCM